MYNLPALYVCDMRLKNKEILPATPLDYFSDGTHICVLMMAKSGVVLTGYDPDSLDVSFQFALSPAPAKQFFRPENDCLYYVSESGEVVGIDTFSSKIAEKINPGPLVPLEFVLTESRMVSFCGVPLLNRGRIAAESFCVTVSDRQTGKKTNQTQTMSGRYAPLTVDDSIYAVVGQGVFKYSWDCELLKSVATTLPCRFPPILTKSYFVTASDIGAVEVFDRNTLEIQSKFIVGSAKSAPVCHKEDMLVWLTNENACAVDAKSGAIKSNRLEHEVISCASVHGKMIYAGCKDGHLAEFNPSNQKLSYLLLERSPLWKPVILDGAVFIASETFLYRVEV
jgi:hypothetical protein